MRILLFFICIGLVVTAKSQNVSGAWYGVADAANAGSNNNNYLTELTIKQKGENVEGYLAIISARDTRVIMFMENTTPKQGY